MRVNIGMPVVRTDEQRAGGRAVYGHVITKFSGMGGFTYPWCFAGGLRAPELRYKGTLISTAILVRCIFLSFIIGRSVERRNI